MLAAAGIAAVAALWCARSRHVRRGSSTSCSYGLSEVCVVKLGGSAITVKERFHTLHEAGLDAAVSQLQRIWQRRLDGRRRLDLVVVHGAGSFGHFEAKQYGISKGTSHSDHQLGFALTRQAVTSLNTTLVSRLLANGLPAVGVSSFPQWSSASAGVMDPAVAAEFAQQVRACLDAGLLPVLHGDAVLDTVQGVAILSGDVLVQELCHRLVPQPSRAVFVSDVPGLFDRPPSEPGAVLVEQVEVAVDGSLSLRMRGFEADGTQLRMTTAAHDTTGGIAQKLKSSVAAARAGVPVWLVQVGSASAGAAISGELSREVSHDAIGSEGEWRRTLVHARTPSVVR